MAARNPLTLFLVGTLLFGCRPPESIPAAEGSIVTLHYTIKSGETFVDSTETRGAVTVRLGKDDGLLAGLREGTLGMKPGEERAFNISPDEGFETGAWAGRMLQARVKVVAVRRDKP